MRLYFHKIVFALAAALFVLPQVALAVSDNVQLLPPTYQGTSTVCDMASNTNQMLIYNGNQAPGSGASAINCNPLFTADPQTGFVATFGPNTGVFQSNVGGSLFTAYDGLSRPAISVYGNIDGNLMPDNIGAALAVRNMSGTGRSINTSGSIAVGTDADSVSLTTSEKVGIGTRTPNTSLDISTKTDAVSMPVGTTANRPNPTPGMMRYNSTIAKMEYYGGVTDSAGVTTFDWITIATSQPQTIQIAAPWPPGLTGPDWPAASTVPNYLDCPAGWVALSCTSIESPSGKFVCDTSVGINPSTGNSSCIQAACGQGEPADPGYYTNVSCAKF